MYLAPADVAFAPATPLLPLLSFSRPPPLSSLARPDTTMGSHGAQPLACASSPASEWAASSSILFRFCSKPGAKHRFVSRQLGVLTENGVALL
jgi:hypothetical protein